MSGYGSTGRSLKYGSKHDELVSEFGALPLPDRVALLEEYHDERARASVRAAQYPSVQGTLQSAAQPRPYEHQEQRAVTNEARQRNMALAAVSVMSGSATFVAFSTVPIFESLRDAIGFSSLQVVLLNAAPLLFGAFFTIPAANFTQNSPLWDMMVWSCAFLMLGTWVSACALMGSPLEYMLLGQWFVGLSIAILVPVPAKYAMYWSPQEGRKIVSTAWNWAMLLGMGLPFLVVPWACGGDGHGKHLGSFLLYKAAFGTAVAAIITFLRANSGKNTGEAEEIAFYRHSNKESFWETTKQCLRNGPLVTILSSLAVAISAGYSFFIFLPFILSLAPFSFTPLQAGLHLWCLAPAGLVGIAVVRSKVFYGLDQSRNYKSAVLSCIAGCAAFLAMFAFLHGRANSLALTAAACGFSASAAALLHLTAHAVLDVGYPIPEPTTSAFAASLVLVASGLAPVASILLTHPLVLDYATDAESPTGVILSMAGIFWMVLLALSFAIVLLGYDESSASRLAVPAEPKVASFVASRVAADLREARAMSEMFVPLAKGSAGAGGRHSRLDDAVGESV